MSSTTLSSDRLFVKYMICFLYFIAVAMLVYLFMESFVLRKFCTTSLIVIPAKAGIYETIENTDSRLRGNDKIVGFLWLCKAFVDYNISVFLCKPEVLN